MEGIGLLYNTSSMVEARLKQVLSRVAAAAARSGRAPEEVRLVGVTKGVPIEWMRAAVEAGLVQLGESRIQEAREKQSALPADITWHLIGHLQKNKAKLAVTGFDWIHSVDSLELIEVLDRQAQEQRQGKPLHLLVQVNVSGEATKHGCAPDEVDALAHRMDASEALSFSGLMTMPPYESDPEAVRPIFRELRKLRDRLAQDFSNGSLDLSMGMSNDFEVAIEEGATWVRVGSAIFQD